MRKNLISFIGFLLGLGVLFLSSCTKMDHFYKDYVIERTYVGKPDSIWANPGYQRVQVGILTPQDPAAKSLLVRWGANDSLVFPINHSVEQNTFMIENLNQSNYLFNLFTLDDKGNRSLPMEISSNVFGPAYGNVTRDRNLSHALDFQNSIALVWFSAALMPSAFIGTEFEFTNLQGEKKIEFIDRNQLGSVHKSADMTKTLQVRSVYLPYTNAFENFYSEWVNLDWSTVLRKNTLTFSSTSYTDGIYVDFQWQRGFLEAEVPEPTGLDIDMAYALGAGSRGNLFTMDGTGFGAFSATWQTAIDAWPHQNEGNMKLLKGVSALSLYDGLRDGSYDQIKAAYEGSNAAAAKRLQSLAVNDIILLHSVERNLFVAIKVTSTPPATSGALGDFVIEFKVGRPNL